MEFKLFKLDIDDLITEFTKHESTSFAEFKKFWLSKKFSVIFEASPSIGQDCFMQTLYAYSIGYMSSTGSLLNRLGGLYCLYCLYETQPFKPSFKMYLLFGYFQLDKMMLFSWRTSFTRTWVRNLKLIR